MRLFRDAKYVTSSVFVSLILAAIRSVLVLRILGPALLGNWKSAMLFLTAGEFLRLGVFRGMGIRVPVLAGQGEETEADRTIAAAGAFCLFMGVVLGIGIFSVSFFVSSPDLRTAIRFVAAVVALAQPYHFLRELAVSRHLFVLRAQEALLGAAIDFAAVVALCKFFGLPGVGIASALAPLMQTLYIRWRQKYSFRVLFDVPRIRDLIRIGLPFSLTEAAFELMRRLDALLIALVLGPTLVGYYGISLLIMDFSTQLAQKGVSQVLSPHLLREFGRTGSSAGVVMFYEMPAQLFCYVLPPLLGVGTLVIPDLVRLILPQYAPGIPAAEVTIWAIFFVALHSSVCSFFVAAEKIPTILKFFAVLIPVGAAAQCLVMKAGLGLLGCAWAALATLALAATGEIYVARRGCGHSRREIASFLGTLYFPLLACIALKALLDSVNFVTWSSAALEAPLKALVLLLFYVPVLFAYESRFSMLRTVYQTR